MSELQRYELVVGGDCTGGSAGDDICGMYPGPKGMHVLYTDHAAAMRERDERIAELENQRTVAINAEKTDCTKALVALSAAGISTPEETYGYNTSWAISDLCRAVASLKKTLDEDQYIAEANLALHAKLDALEAENARLSAAVTDAEWKSIPKLMAGNSNYSSRDEVDALIAARKGAA